MNSFRIMDMESLSSEGEEDIKHPSSIRAVFKRIVQECLALGHQANNDEAELCQKLTAATLQEKSHITDDELETGIRDLSIHSPDNASNAVKPVKARLKEFPCSKCGHVFGMQKTRSMHQKVCVG